MYCLVEVTGFEPANSPGPKPGAIPSFATPRNVINSSFLFFQLQSNMGSNPFLIKLKTRVFSFFLRFSPFFSLFQSAPPEKVRCSQTADEHFFASFWLRLGLFSPFSACFLSVISIVSPRCFSGYCQIWGQTANRPTSRNARWGTSLIIHSYRRL